MAHIRKPDLPKALAARIRAAQRKVQDKRLSIIHGDRRIEKARGRVNLYDINPYAYADEYYSGRGVDSYPVQTGINRDREELDYYQRRAPERIVELAEAETNLARVEDEVLISVLKMRPSTGRVPWPRPLKSLESERYQVELRLAREEERSKARHARVMEILNNRAKKDDESFRAAIAKLVEGIKIEMEKMPNAKRENFASRLAERLALLEQGEIGPLEFLSDFSNE